MGGVQPVPVRPSTYPPHHLHAALLVPADVIAAVLACRFQPRYGTALRPISSDAVELSVFRGPGVQLVHQRWNEWLSQTWRLEFANPWAEVEWTVGPIAFEDGVSREVVTRYSTDIASAGELWTDANGREFQRRLRNRRPSFNFTLVSPIASNYYPVTTAVKLNDSERAFGVLVDRAQGAASLQDGAIELMVHRRLLCSSCDFENENETDAAVYRDGQLVERLGRGLIVTGSHRLVLGAPAQVSTALRHGQQELYRPLHAVFAATPSAEGRLGEVSFLNTALPLDVELMTLQVLFDGSVLLRLAHMLAVGEPGAGPITIDLSTLFVQPITSIKQRTLTANGDYEPGAKHRLPFATDRQIDPSEWARVDAMHRGLRDTSITIYPMQVVAFALHF